MQLLLRIFLMIFPILLTSCVNTSTIIHIHPNGSGTIEEILVIRKDIATGLDHMDERTKKFGKNGKSKSPGIAKMMMNRKAIEKRAKKMGEGVRLKSLQSISEKDGVGYKAIYSFKDISKIKLEQNPGNKLPGTAGKKGGRVDENIRFGFKKGKVSELIIKRPIKAKSAITKTRKKTKKDKKIDKMQFDVLKKVFEGFRMRIVVKVKGRLIETNATHRKKNTIILVNLDFEKMLKKPEILRQISDKDAKSVENIKDQLSKIPGVQIEVKEKVVVKFNDAKTS